MCIISTLYDIACWVCYTIVITIEHALFYSSMIFYMHFFVKFGPTRVFDRQMKHLKNFADNENSDTFQFTSCFIMFFFKLKEFLMFVYFLFEINHVRSRKKNFESTARSTTSFQSFLVNVVIRFIYEKYEKNFIVCFQHYAWKYARRTPKFCYIISYQFSCMEMIQVTQNELTIVDLKIPDTTLMAIIPGFNILYKIK